MKFENWVQETLRSQYQFQQEVGAMTVEPMAVAQRP
jgi:hypothetical protein